MGDLGVLITGATGMLGKILTRSLRGMCRLRLMDIDPRGEEEVIRADLSQWDPDWVSAFRGVDVLVHLAADPVAQQTWPKLVAPNMDALVNAFLAAADGGVRRVVFASSNHVMGGYSDDPEPPLLTADTPPKPGAKYRVGDEFRDSTAYAATKLFGERLGKCMADARGLEVVAVRIGWAGRPVPPERDSWWHQMFLTDRDFCHLMERCIMAELPQKFLVVNGMSRNPGMRWDVETAGRLIGYEPEAR